MEIDWNYQPPLEDLLNDDIMEPVLDKAGLSSEELRNLMLETAERLDDTSEEPPDL